MFPVRYFAARYFAPRYWQPGAGGAPPTPTPDVQSDIIENPGRRILGGAGRSII